jgi:hypothetical protein
LLVSAYRDPGSRRVVTVLVNRATEERHIQMVAPGVGAARIYRTTNEPGVNLKFIGMLRANELLVVPARSMTTLVSG